MSPSEGFRYKSPEELQSQFQSAQDVVGGKEELAFAPPSIDLDEIFSLPISEIKQKYARRYEMYLQILRKKRVEGALFEEEEKYFRKWLSALNSLDTYIQKHHEGEDVTLKDEQITVFEDLRDFVEAGGKEGYVKLPTGVGKTVLFTEFVEALNLRAIIVVPTQVLIGQTEEKIEKFAPDLDVGKIYSGAKQFGRQVTLITYDSFVAQVEAGTMKPEDYECLILDEVHVSLSKKRMKIVRQFEDALKIGFTATPEFSERKQVSDLLSTEIHSMNIPEAIDENLLASFSSILARTTVDISNVTVTSRGEYSESELDQAVNVQGRNKAAVDLYKQGFNGQLALAYCAGIDHAKDLATLFIENGIPSAVISGKTEKKEQKNILKKFHRGEIKVLCNSDILIAGFDEPRASVCLNLRPTRSRVVAEQRGGRVLRLNEEYPSKHAYIIDFVDQRVPETQLPILFADVAGGTEILSRAPQEDWGTGGGGKGRKPGSDFSDIRVEGLEIVTDIEEIMKVVKSREEKEPVEKVFMNYGDFEMEVREAKIRTGDGYNEYRRLFKKDEWPSTPYITYKGKGWVNWYKLCGKFDRKRGYPSYKDLEQSVRSKGITSADQYNQVREENRWPSTPEKHYKEWTSWPEFLDKKERFPAWADFVIQVKNSGVKKPSEYKKVWKEKGWPANPDETYKDYWEGGWDVLFGKIPSWDDWVKQVRESGVENERLYLKICRSRGWPSFPNEVYTKHWKSWRKFFSW